MLKLLGMIRGETSKLALKYDTIAASRRQAAAQKNEASEATMRKVQQQKQHNNLALQYHNVSSSSTDSSSHDLSITNKSRGRTLFIILRTFSFLSIQINRNYYPYFI